jgi:hypothetical protein
MLLLTSLQRLDCEPHGRALLALQLELHKRRLSVKVKSVRFYIASGDGNGFDSLVNGGGTDGLNLDFTLAS